MFAGQEASRHRCLSLTVHGGKRTAQRDLAKLVVEVEQGQVTAGHPGSVSELLGPGSTTPLPCVLGTRAPTLRRPRHPANLRRLASRQADRQSPRPHVRRPACPGLSPGSVRRRHVVIHAALDRAIKPGGELHTRHARTRGPGPAKAISARHAWPIMNSTLFGRSGSQVSTEYSSGDPVAFPMGLTRPGRTSVNGHRLSAVAPHRTGGCDGGPAGHHARLDGGRWGLHLLMA